MRGDVRFCAGIGQRLLYRHPVRRRFHSRLATTLLKALAYDIPLLTLYGRPPPLDVSWRVTGPAEQSRTPRDCGAGRVTVTPPAGQSFPRGAGSERGRRALAYDIAY